MTADPRGTVRKALIAWKSEDQPDKPRAVIERWADWVIDAALATPAQPALDVGAVRAALDAAMPTAAPHTEEEAQRTLARLQGQPET